MTLTIVALVGGSVLTTNSKPAHAYCIPCIACYPWDLGIAAAGMLALRVLYEKLVKLDIEYLMNMEENWIIEDFFEEYWVKGLAELTEYLSAYGLYQTEMVGSFFDARNHIETSRLIFRLQAEAHRDYQPSDDFCWFGTNARSLASSESRARVNMLALSKYAIDRQLGKKGFSAENKTGDDKTKRWSQFIKTYCDPKDNNWSAAGTGLQVACDHDGSGAGGTSGADDLSRANIDIDYTRAVEIPRTININFSSDDGGISSLSDEEENIIALSSNLFGSDVFSRTLNYDAMKDYSDAGNVYLDQRTVIAKRSVAQNSFNAIVAMKASGTSSSTDGPATASYMAAILKELMPDDAEADEIFEILGENPSYYAQLEILSKKIYESPKFFAKLYDTPANVERKIVAMKAIELMVDRALFESELRQEMLLSVMISTDLDNTFLNVNGRMPKGDTQ